MFTCPKTGLLLDTNHLTRIQYKGLELAADPDSHFWQCPGSAFCWFPSLGDSVIERSSHRREASRGRSKGIQGQGRGPLSPPGPVLWQLPWVWCLSGSCFQPGCLCRSFSGIATIPNKPSSKFTKWMNVSGWKSFSLVFVIFFNLVTWYSYVIFCFAITPNPHNPTLLSLSQLVPASCILLNANNLFKVSEM